MSNIPVNILQDYVLSCILNDSYVLSKVKDDIRISNFTKITYRYIYKGLIYYYNKYHKTPNRSELILVVSDLLSDNICSLEDIIKDLSKLDEVSSSKVSTDFIIDQVTRFIRINRLEDLLNEYIPRIKNGDNLSVDDLSSKLSENINIDLHHSKAYNISDTDTLVDIRRDSVGIDSNPVIIKSSLEAINNSLLYKGYKSGDISVVVAKPGCFTGDTEIVLDNNSVITIKELSRSDNKYKLLGYDKLSKKYVSSSYIVATKTTEVNELYYMYFKGYDKPVKCTRDHLFLTSDLEYVRADKLWLHSTRKILSNNEEGYIEFLYHEVHYYREPIEVYDIYKSDHENYVVNLKEGVGLSVHNCGKTMFMINELSHAARQNYKALHLFIGDMTEYDGFIRYISNISGVDQDSIASMNLDDQSKLVKSLNKELINNITVKSYAASEITVDQMIEDVFKIQDDFKTHFDIIAVDYPDNLIKDSNSMYESGGDIYNKLSYLARRNRCVLLVGSQPKINYWSDEIIPLSGCAESSKKQHIADIIVTLGKSNNDSNLLTGFLAKVRRGTMGNIFRVKTEFDKARLKMISEFDYIQEKSKS